MQPIIEFHQVSKAYGKENTALYNISLSIKKGELIYLAGTSGAGKSTIMKMIAAIEQPSSGMLLVNGQDLSRIRKHALPLLRRNLGLVFQQQKLLSDRCVLENVMLPLLASGVSRKEAKVRASAALDKLGILEKSSQQPQCLSGGEQQVVSIARAIVNRPQIILADEPCANLDRTSANKVLGALKEFHNAGVTCIMTCHDDHAQETNSRMIYLKAGKIVEQAPDCIGSYESHLYTRRVA